MSIKASASLMSELKHYGLKDANLCFNCGNCTGVCPMATNDNTFPRRFMRYVQLGLRDRILKSPEPWLCYYCGECSDRCPRQADPGETMMTMRRYLTAQYDWTGFSRRFYTSEAFEVIAVTITALLVAAAFVVFGDWSASSQKVQLNTFAPAPVIEILDLIMAACLTFVLLGNVWRCVKFVMGDDLRKIPLSYYLSKIKDLIWNVMTQWQFSKCDKKYPWLNHLLIMTGYSSVFLMVVVFLRWFQRESPINPDYPLISILMSLVGYYATAAILYATTVSIIKRIKKTEAPYKHSHGTDWMFLILLQLTTITGILVHAFIFLGWAMPTYVIYVIHIAIAVPMLVLEVPFAKWAHLAYRPVVLILNRIRQDYYADYPATAAEPAEAEPVAAEAAG